MFITTLTVKSQHDQRDVGRLVQESYDKEPGGATLPNGLATAEQHSTRVSSFPVSLLLSEYSIKPIHIFLFCSSPQKAFDAEGPTDQQMIER